MTALDKQRLTKERDEIEARMKAAASDLDALAVLNAQFGERLSHIKARLEPQEAKSSGK